MDWISNNDSYVHYYSSLSITSNKIICEETQCRQIEQCICYLRAWKQFFLRHVKISFYHIQLEQTKAAFFERGICSTQMPKSIGYSMREANTSTKSSHHRQSNICSERMLQLMEDFQSMLLPKITNNSYQVFLPFAKHLGMRLVSSQMNPQFS